MLTKQECIDQVLTGRGRRLNRSGEAFAPANIALCKYWGKRDDALNLPVTSSLSISLDRRGDHTVLSAIDSPSDEILLNGEPVRPERDFAVRVTAFLDGFRRTPSQRFRVDTTNTVPTAAGLASSASGFAALVLALDKLMDWGLDRTALSVLARLGSGSACRSVHDGFVVWHRGDREDGMDSFAEPLGPSWPSLRIGIVSVSVAAKPISSRSAMDRTRKSSRLYESWPRKVADDLDRILIAIRNHDFNQLGTTAESNALSMHATMIATWPPVVYWLPQSLERMRRVWALRDQGLPLYFTMDAGPNLKLLFEATHEDAVRAAFPDCDVIAPFFSSA